MDIHILIFKGNAEKSRIVMVGDALKKASNVSSGGFIDIKDLRDAEYGILHFVWIENTVELFNYFVFTFGDKLKCLMHYTVELSHLI